MSICRGESVVAGSPVWCLRNNYTFVALKLAWGEARGRECIRSTLERFLRDIHNIRRSQIKELLAFPVEHALEIQYVALQLAFFVSEDDDSPHIGFGIIESSGLHERLEDGNGPLRHQLSGVHHRSCHEDRVRRGL